MLAFVMARVAFYAIYANGCLGLAIEAGVWGNQASIYLGGLLFLAVLAPSVSLPILLNRWVRRIREKWYS